MPRLRPVFALFFTMMLMAHSTSYSAIDDHNVLIVLDASGSMSRNMEGSSMSKMDAAKLALIEAIQGLPDKTNIGILVFSASNISDDWIYPLGPIDSDKLIAAIHRPQPGGKTPLGAYIKKAADRLLERRKEQYGYGTYRLLVVTDGEADDRRDVDRFVPEVMARGITVDAIGLNMKSTHTLATQVHSYRSANQPDSLKKAIQEVFAEISGSGDDSTTEEAFALIQALPDEAATRAVQALASSGNHPIGEKPSVRPKDRIVREDREIHAEVQPQRSTNPIWVLVIVVVLVFTIARKTIMKR